jgi:hypothetical protein
MKRALFCFSAVAFLLFACNISTTIVPTETGGTTASSETPTTAIPAADTATVTQTPTIASNVTCNELALMLDPGLASSFNCQTIPAAGSASDPAFAVNPQYTEVTFQGYILPNTFFPAHISVYPVQDFSALAPDIVNAKVAALQQLIGGGALPAKGALPLLPVFNAAEEFRAQYKLLSFSGGKGIRYLTQYSQFFDPINNHEIFYSFQGLTADGRYWISAILPISNPILPPNGDNPPAGMTWDQLSSQFDTYVADIIVKLEAQPPDSYSPTIAALDALIASITVHP